MKNVIIALLLCLPMFAQTAATKPAVKPQTQCTTALKATSQAVDSLSAEVAALRAERDKLKADNDQLALDNKSLLAINDDLGKKNENLRNGTVALLTENTKQLQNLAASNAALTDKYNELLQQANGVINTQNARLARQQQVANALALYSLMPKPQPYILPPVTQPVNLNCTTTAIGTTAYTNCH